MKLLAVWNEEREKGISNMSGLLKFITCGSVDDGKSTLIGHILYRFKVIVYRPGKSTELDSKVGSRGGEDRLLTASRRIDGRARAGNHDRRCVPLLYDREKKLHRCGHTGT